jgi:hypothetical protein
MSFWCILCLVYIHIVVCRGRVYLVFLGFLKIFYRKKYLWCFHIFFFFFFLHTGLKGMHLSFIHRYILSNTYGYSVLMYIYYTVIDGLCVYFCFILQEEGKHLYLRFLLHFKWEFKTLYACLLSYEDPCIAVAF